MRGRLDHLLVTRGLVASRARAADLIARGAVLVDGAVAGKAGQLVEATAALVVDADANAYVARSGLKLKAALDTFGLEARGRVALDVGASTGGFTQVLLEAGAERVYAVDVGHGQLHDSLRADHRVVSLERTDARSLDRQAIPEPVTAVAADVSFVSLKDVLAAPLSLAGPGAWLVALVKPQFEVGRTAVSRRGLVRDGELAVAAVAAVSGFLAGLGWTEFARAPSPLPGKEGNIEWLLGARRHE
ncbi:MAG: TlyA family RNA methyltransferase [Hyphomicrobiaceae bacterium]|nr:TlyA family RNA methyltransferase [Hyphomicrobiaceae bacterium]